jgi:hypothetical protein
MINGGFLGGAGEANRDNNYILHNVDRLTDFPVHIVHGRYDRVCHLHQAETLVRHCAARAIVRFTTSSRLPGVAVSSPKPIPDCALSWTICCPPMFHCSHHRPIGAACSSIEGLSEQAMQLPPMPFTVTNWSGVTPTVHPTEPGQSIWRTLTIGNFRASRATARYRLLRRPRRIRRVQALPRRRRSFATGELPEEKVEAIRTSRMDAARSSRQVARSQRAGAHGDPQFGAGLRFRKP